MTILRAARLERAGFSHAFPERDTPDAALLEALGRSTVIQVKQVHGARAVLAAEAAGQEGDALVARAGEGALGVRVADCVPVLVADPASGAVAAIHAGWRGVAGGVLAAGVGLLGGRELVAAIGPCIG
ncbi:MAG TPA: laccase domain-containing protein, partial [Polyangiaceae bacterium]|nr:laccase domain-containing protein [Polyangiaceae bacterium]